MTIVNLINKQAEKKVKEVNPWETSPYKNLLLLTIDERGHLGEEIFSNACHTTSLIINEDISNKNTKDNNKHYDIVINNKYIEVKTAYRDNGNKWQHEGIYKNTDCCDIVAFIDFDYHGIYFSIFKTADLPLNQNSEFFPRKHGTLRKNHIDDFKLDFSRTTFKNFNNRHSIFLSEEEATFENIGKFIEKELLNYALNS